MFGFVALGPKTDKQKIITWDKIIDYVAFTAQTEILLAETEVKHSKFFYCMFLLDLAVGLKSDLHHHSHQSKMKSKILRGVLPIAQPKYK